MHYIVGLGNPGKKYEGTRHNVGRDLLLAVAKEEAMGEWQKSKGANALYLRGTVADEPVELLLPETYMNKSGESVLYLVKKHDVRPEQLVVVYDDVDLPVGEVKISVGKGSGGHNGIESIIKAVGSKDFVRLRIGVAGKSFWTGKPRRPEGGAAMTQHVLGTFSRRERSNLAEAFDKAKEALQIILSQGVEQAMNDCN